MRATKHSAAFDVCANESILIQPGETVLVGLGIKIDEEVQKGLVKLIDGMPPFLIPVMETHYLELHPRSSLRLSGLGGGSGIIDMDYEFEIKMVISNPVHFTAYQVTKGDRIGQMLLKRHEGKYLHSKYTKDDNRTGGFGSTTADFSSCKLKSK